MPSPPSPVLHPQFLILNSQFSILNSQFSIFNSPFPAYQSYPIQNWNLGLRHCSAAAAP
jgi:hypothetical protein